MNLRHVFQQRLRTLRTKSAGTTVKLETQRLEDRTNPAPIPSVGNLPAAGSLQPFLGESTNFSFTVANTGDAVGYSPYFDLVLDTSGDASITPDSPNDGFDGTPTVRAAGLDLTPVGTTTVGGGGTYTNPFTGQAGIAAPAGTGPGDTVFIYRLPFGSFTPGQSTTVNVTTQVDPKANVGKPLGIGVDPGFRDGASSTGGVTVTGPTATTDATPVLFTAKKVYLGPEDETATGPNFARQYRIDLDIASGQTLTTLRADDILASSMRLTGATSAQISAFVYAAPNSVPGSGASVFNAVDLSGTATTNPAPIPGGNVSYNFGTKTGVPGVDASLLFQFYIPRDRSAVPGGQVLPQTPTTGTDSVLDVNRAGGSGAWNPLDPLEARNQPIAVTVPPLSPTPTGPNVHQLQEHSLATQKTVAAFNLATGAAVTNTPTDPLQPGKTLLRYTIDFQVSDYYAFDNVFLQDLLGDGQRLYTGPLPAGLGGGSSTPTLGVTNAFQPSLSAAAGSRTGTAAAAFSGANTIDYRRQFTTTDALANPTTYAAAGSPTGAIYNPQAATPVTAPADPAAGSTFLQFNVSQELIARGFVGGRLVGGEIADGGANPTNNAFGAQQFGATTGQIVFYAEVRENFANAFLAPKNASVDQGDILGNAVPLIQGSQLAPTTINAAAPTVIGTGTDDSAASLVVPYGVQKKVIYAYNGTLLPAAGFDTVQAVQAGDRVTFKLTYTLPISSFENLKLIDFPPLPVIGVAPSYTFEGTTPSFAANTVAYAPDDTYNVVFPGADPVITSNATTNAITFDFGSRNDVLQRRTATISLLVTLPIGSDPFAADLFLTNQLRVSEDSTNAGAVTVEDLRRFELVVPQVLVRKGAVATGTTGLTGGGITFANASNPAGTFTVGGNAVSGTNALATAAQATGVGNLNLGGLDANDTVRYAIVAQNTGRGDAFGVTLTDTVPADYVRPATLAGLNLRVLRGDGTPLTAGTDYTIAYVPATGQFTITLADNYTAGNTTAATLDTRTGGLSRGASTVGPVTNGSNTVVVLYDVTLLSTPTPVAYKDIVNTARITNVQSTPGGPDLTDPAVTPGGTEPTDIATVTIATPNVAKALVGTSVVDATNSNAQAVVGELVTYRITINVPETSQANFNITDTLPSGLAFQQVNLVTVTGLTTTLVPGTGVAPANLTVANAGQLLTFNFGTVVNGATVANGTTFGTITIEYTAVVLNTPGNQAGTTLTNTARVNFDNAPQIQSTASVAVVEPTVTTTKGVNAANAQAGDTITYTVTLSVPAGSPTAFEVALRDALPTAAVNFSSVIGYTGPGAYSAANFAITGGVLQTVSPLASLTAGQTIILTVTGTVRIGVTPNQLVSNAATTSFTSLTDDVTAALSTYNPLSVERTGDPANPGGTDNDYRSTGTANFTIFTPTPVKSIVATSEAGTLGASVAVGEVVRYRLAVQVPRSTLANFQLVDTLVAGLAYLPGTARVMFVSNPAGAITSSTITDPAAQQTSLATTPTALLADPTLAGNVATFSLGDLVNSATGAGIEYVVIEFDVLVLNVTGNQSGTPLDNSFQTFINSVANGAASAPVTVTVAEPVVGITKAVSPGGGDAGDTITYTVTLTNSGNAPAYNVGLSDLIPGTFGSPAITGVTTNGTGITGANFQLTGNTLSTTGTGFTLAVGQNVVITFTAVLTSAVAPNQTITNTAAATYTSLPGANGTADATPGAAGSSTGERTGGGGTLNDYTGSASASIVVPNGSLVKSIAGTSLVGTANANVAVGEVVTYALAVTLPEGTSTPVVLTDVLPAGVVFVPGSVVVDATGFNGSVAGTATASVVGNTLTITLPGPVVVTGDNVTGNNTFVVRYQTRVLDVVGNVGFSPGNTTLTNSASLQAGAAPVVPGNGVTATVVEPQLTVVKDVTNADTSVDAGTSLTYRVVISHTGASQAPAYNVTLADALAAVGLTLDTLLVGIAAGNILLVAPAYTTVVSNTSTASALNLVFSELRPGDTITVTYKATLTATPAPGSTVRNTATVNYATAPTNGRAEPQITDPADITVNTNSLAGEVYSDLNNNGVRDGTEALITGQPITLILTGVDHLGTTITPVTVTTSTGQYSFTGLRPGNYTVTEVTQPTGFLDGRDTPGTPFPGTGTPANAARTPRDVDRISAVTIPLNAPQNGVANAGVNFDFGELLPASLGDRVWLDANGNGLLDGGEAGIDGVSVTLSGTDDTGATVNATTATAGGGLYSFAGLRPGSYVVTFGNTDGTTTYTRTVQTSTAPGATTANDSNANPATGVSPAVTLVAGQVEPTIDAGLYLPVTIGDTVFFDPSGDGVQQAGEPGIAGVTVVLQYAGLDGLFGTADDNVTAASATTDAAGNYLFAGRAPGSYRVAVTTATVPNSLTANTTPTTQATGLLTSGTSDLARDFGFRGTASLGDRLWFDINGSGVQDGVATEPGVPGATVALTWAGFDGLLGTADDVPLGTAITTATGNYTFANLPSGTFLVTVVPASLPGNLAATYDLDSLLVNPDGKAVRVLAGGENATDVDFGYRGTSSIGDTVWYDVNGNGTQETGTVNEPGIGGATVVLAWAGNDNTPGTADDVTFTTTTDATGKYSFPGLPVIGASSKYAVTVTPPAQYTTQTFDADGVGSPNTSTLSLAAGTADIAQDFGYRGSANTGLGDFVWLDVNGNGRQDSGEPGIDGVTVQLLDTATGNVIGQTVTAAGGAYQFPNLIPGTYAVRFGTTDGTTNYTRTLRTSPVATAGTDSNADAATGLSAPIPLTAGQFDRTLDAGLYVPVSIGDTLWYDANNSGTASPDAGEPGLTGVRVVLDSAGPDGLFGTPDDATGVATATTDAAGQYLFPGRAPGTYRVRVDATTLPPGLATPTFDLDGLGSANQADLVAVSGVDRLDADFSYRGTATLGDRVWIDADGDGLQGPVALEPGLPGVRVVARWFGQDGVANTADDVTRTATTDATGAYLFTNLPAGQFRVSIDPTSLPGNLAATADLDSGTTSPDGTTLTTLTPGQNRTDVDFGYRGPASIGDTVWYDVDASGAQNNQEPGIAGATVVLTWAGTDDTPGTADDVTFTTTTDTTGKYSFPGLPVVGAGSLYTVTVTPVAGYPTQTFDADGVGTANRSQLTLAPTENNAAQDFGYRGTADTGLGNFVWDDTNGNGRQDLNEPGIVGVTVQLFTADRSRLLAVTTTDAKGAYAFPGLAPSAVFGAYSVQFVAPAGFVGTTLNSKVATPANDSNADRATGYTTPVALTVGQFDDSVDAGFYRPVTLGDRVWYDTNGDGQQAATNEPGLVGATVTVTGFGEDGVPGGGDDKVFTAITGPDGIWTVPNLQPGNFSVTVDVTTATGGPGLTANTTPTSRTVTASSGDVIRTLDFGFTAGPASVGDRLWLDLNRDGNQDAAEPGLPGLPVSLRWYGQDGVAGTADDVDFGTVTTGPDGVYLFPNLPLGKYQVDALTAATNLLNTYDLDSGTVAPNASTVVVLGAANPNRRDADFGLVGQASVGDRVWFDLNRDNLQQPTEAGIPGAVVELRGAGADGNLDTPDDLVLTATTAANGVYGFAGLPVFGAAGSTPYTVRVVSQPVAGLVSVSDLDGNATPGVAAFPLGNLQNRTDVDFGYDGTAALSGTVYRDDGNNGLIDPNEPGIAGVLVTLTGFDTLGNAILDPATGKAYQTTTDAAGRYSFDTVVPGTYTVTETQPAAFTDGLDSAGSLGGNAGNDVISGVVIPPDGRGTGYNFGERAAPVSGTVFRDDTRDGVRQPGEPGIPGVTIALVDAAGVTVGTATTGPDGSYRFDNVPAGDYRLVETQPAGYGDSPVGPSVVRPVTVPLAGIADQNFGETLGSLAGRVSVDANDNGRFDAGETPLANVAVVLSGGGLAAPVTAFTDAAGQYQFPQLLGGTYTVTEGSADPYADGKPNAAGSVGGTAGGPNVFTAVTLPGGVNATAYDFGERPPANPFLAGAVYRDDDKSGTRQPAEPGIPGVTVTLRGAGPDGFFGTADDSFATATTDASGNYLFTNLTTGGAYRVQESQPLIYGSTTPNLIAVAKLPAAGLTDQNYGESLSSLAGTVYFDADRDGLRGAGEPAIPGTLVTLTGTDAVGNPVSRTATTDANGNYLFPLLPAAGDKGYVVTETQPAGYNQGTNAPGTVGGVVVADAIVGVVLGPGVAATDYNFGEVGSAVSGVVYYDPNRSGTRDPGEPPIAGVVVQLVDGTGRVVGTATTGPDGTFTFANVPPGDYVVRELQPAGYGDSTPNALPVTVGTAPVTGLSFGETLSTLAGSVYLDANDDGVRQPGELGLSGVPVVLTSVDGLVTRTVNTDAAGNYRFTDLPTEIYRVTEPTQPAGFGDGRETPGSAGGTLTTNDAIDTVPVGAGTDLTRYNFGERPPVTAPGTTFLAGTVYLDANGDGQLNSGEVTLPGVVVTLTDGQGTVVGTRTTDASGNYLFVNLSPEVAYTLTETQPAAYLSGPENATNVVAVGVVPLTGRTGLNFGETPAAIAGTVYFDRNADGTLTAGTDPVLSGVTVTLIAAGPDGTLGTPDDVTVATALTAFNGTYRFGNLPAGTYAVVETQPAGYAQGTNSPGTQGGTVAGDTLTGIALPAGVTATGNNFGERGAAVSGTVFRDDTGDGTPQAGEPRLPGVVVTLRDAQGNVVGVVTTGPDGGYTFGNLPAGNYTVTESQPAGYGNSPGTPATVRAFALTPAGLTGQNFGETLGRVSGFVYQDYDLNATRTTAGPRPDTGIAGIVVTLTGTDLLGNPVTRVATTAADGSYTFDNLFPGNYRVTETQPPLPQSIGDGGFYDAADNLGSLGGEAVVKNEFRLTLANNPNGSSQAGTDYNFGEVPPADPFGFAFVDANNNGVFDPGEAPIAGVVVTIRGFVNDPILGVRPLTAADVPGGLTRTTGADGKYEFVPIPPGVYGLREAQPAGFLDGREQNGDPLLPASTVVADDDFSNVETAPFQVRGPFNFGELLPASVRGAVYVDANNNGVFDAGEQPLAGVRVALTGTDDRGNPVSLAAVTDGQGGYLFAGLRPGTYALSEAQPSPYRQGRNAVGSAGGSLTGVDGITGIPLASGTASVGNNFGELLPRPAPVGPLPPLPVIPAPTPPPVGPTDPSKRDFLAGTPVAAATVPTGVNRPTGRLVPDFVALGSINTTRLTQFLTTADGANGGTVRVFDLTQGQERFRLTPFAGSPVAAGTINPGVRSLTADFNGDAIPDIVVAAGPGQEPRVVIYDGSTGAVLRDYLAFEAGFTGGLFLAAGDFDNDGRADLVVSPDVGGGPRVRVFRGGDPTRLLADFFGIDDPAFRGGARVAAGDFNNDGVPDLVVAAGVGGGPRVAVVDGTSLAGTPRHLVADFFAFESTLRNGVYVAAGDVDGDGRTDLILGAGPGGAPRVLAVSGASLIAGAGLVPVANFFAGDPAARGGVSLTALDITGDGRVEVVTGSAAPDVPVVRVFDPVTGRKLDEFYAEDANFTGAVYVG